MGSAASVLLKAQVENAKKTGVLVFTNQGYQYIPPQVTSIQQHTRQCRGSTQHSHAGAEPPPRAQAAGHVRQQDSSDSGAGRWAQVGTGRSLMSASVGGLGPTECVKYF